MSVFFKQARQELRAWCEWLAEIIGIQIGGDDDIFRGWRGTEDFVEMTGEGASVGAAEEKLLDGS